VVGGAERAAAFLAELRVLAVVVPAGGADHRPWL
jgi:hypothetical protein